MIRGTLSQRHFNPCGDAARPIGRDIAVHSPTSNHLDNKMLAALPRSQFNLLVPHLTVATLAQGTVVYETGDEVDQVFFPHNGMFSLLAVMRDGKAIETATVGREGVIGAMAGLGLYTTLGAVVVALALTTVKIDTSEIRERVPMS